MPYKWSITSGSLPPGVTLTASSGSIAGTPTELGAYPIAVQVKDSGSPAQTASQGLSIVITAVPTITAQPINETVPVSQTATFTVLANGTAPLSYQWYMNGAAIGSNSSSYTTSPTTSADNQAQVKVEVSNSAGSVTSDAATLTVNAAQSVGKSYFLATAADGGDDSNDGLSVETPWLTPNHALNCGDTITAAASIDYSTGSFTRGKWGTVTCSAGNNVAWLQCARFDACKISSSSESGFMVSSNYWGIQGWEVSATGTYSSCFVATPPSTLTIHHIVFANDIANGCGANGFTTFNNGNASVDYVAIIGDIVYDAAQSNSGCYSGISIYQPVQSDNLPGTHIYVAGNLSYNNLDPNPCAGGTPTDGEGIIFDTWDGSQGSLPSAYSAQGVAENNILISNGGRGLEVFNNQNGTEHASIYLRYNTVWGNNTDRNQNATYCGEVLIARALDVQAEFNIAATSSATGCGANPNYGWYVGSGDSSDNVDSNLGYSASGTNDGADNNTGFSYGTDNIFGIDPDFANPATPRAPACGSFTSVPNCIATIIAEFQAQAPQASGWGYQPVDSNGTSDPLFPQWLCNVNLPSGLITMGCST
jgi:hypothetical protein